MSSFGKIARLPHIIREQLNRRLHDGEAGTRLVEWLNGLPEVQAVVAAEFGGRPVREQNLSEWKQRGYRDWEARQAAVELVRSMEGDAPEDQATFAGRLSDRLAQWVAMRYAAAAQALAAAPAQPDEEWRRLREFCEDIASLRRGDHSAKRLLLEQEWLELQQANTAQQREKDFWLWTKRPEIHEKLHPDQQRGISPEVLAIMTRELNLM